MLSFLSFHLFISELIVVFRMALSSGEGHVQAEAEVAAVVLAADGAFTELEQFSYSSIGSELPAAVDEVLWDENSAACCRFSRKVTDSNIEAANALLEIALSSEFRKYSSFDFLLLCTKLLRWAGVRLRRVHISSFTLGSNSQCVLVSSIKAFCRQVSYYAV